MIDCNHTEGPYHDCLYVDQRNSLISVAVVMASNLHPRPANTTNEVLLDHWRKKWDASFLSAMDFLWRKDKKAFETAGVRTLSEVNENSGHIEITNQGRPSTN
jgi:hypothetical protein